MPNNMELHVPDTPYVLVPGCKVKLGRFDTTVWLVGFDWYAWGNNREVCGWFLRNVDDANMIKPLQKTDLDDIYLIES